MTKFAIDRVTWIQYERRVTGRISSIALNMSAILQIDSVEILFTRGLRREFSYQTSKEGSTEGKRDRKSRRRRRERTNTIIKVLLCITARQRQQQYGRAKGEGKDTAGSEK